MSDLFLPSRPIVSLSIDAFASTHPEHANLLKVGSTERTAADRIAKQFPSGLLLKGSGMGRRIDVRRDLA